MNRWGVHWESIRPSITTLLQGLHSAFGGESPGMTEERKQGQEAEEEELEDAEAELLPDREQMSVLHPSPATDPGIIAQEPFPPDS